jgi:hypothetical protein
MIRLHNSFNDDTNEQPIVITMLLRKKKITWPFSPILPKKKKNVKTLRILKHEVNVMMNLNM